MNLFDLMATISLDSSAYEQGLEAANNNAKTFGKKIGDALSTIGRVSTVAIGAAATGVTAITKSAVESYADYEQLAGGIETLFGKAASRVIADADAAFKTAGVSVNEYMETSIQSAAALINSLGGNQAEAARLMNVSITDMADNVNKMGTSMEAVQNAYRGFSRGNFTMLDNLALGFAGTKEGMEELLATARDISGVEYDISSYSDIVKAINVVQTKMGITGTTAKEAASTVSGSAGAMRSAWRNLVTGLASDEANMDSLVGDFVESLETMIGNIVPIVERVLRSLGPAIQKATPMLVETLAGLLTSALPAIVGVAGELVTSLSQAFADNAEAIAEAASTLLILLGEGIIQNLPLLLETGLNIIMMIGQSISDNLPVIIDAITQAINEIAVILSDPETLSALLLTTLTILQTIGMSIIDNLPVLIDTVMQVINNIINFMVENLPLFVDMAMQMMMALANGLIEALPNLLAQIPIIIDNLTQSILNLLPQIVETGVTLITSLVSDLPRIIMIIVEAVPKIVDSIVNSFVTLVPALIDAGITLFTALVEALPEIITTICDALPLIIDSVVDALFDMLPIIIDAGVRLFTALIDNLPKIIDTLVDNMPQIIDAIVGALVGAVPKLMEAGGQLITGLWQGISNVGEWLREKISGFFGGVVQSIKNFFGIKSPSKVFAGIGEMLDRGLAKGIGDYADMAVDAAESMAEDVFGATDRDFNFTATGDAYGNDATARRGVVINVYGAEGQDVNELAEVISQKIAFGYTQEQAVFA